MQSVKGGDDMSGLPERVGMGAVSKEVRLIEYFDEGGPSFLVALCSTEGCENLARGFRDKDVPVCFDHAAQRVEDKRA
jgi:hypothetical protein